MIALRDYQRELVARVTETFARGTRTACVQLMTGGGKTACAASILHEEVVAGHRAIFLAHLEDLLVDTHQRLAAAGVWCGFVQAGRAQSPLAPVQVCSLQTLRVRAALRPPADLVIVDECHRAAAASVRRILAAYPHARLIGLTATPARSDGQPLGDIFEALIVGPSTKWLTEHGYVVPCHIVAPREFEERGLVADPVEAYERHTPGTRAIVFAASVVHAEAITRRFVERGVAAECVTGETSRVVRRGLRDRIASGETRVLVGVMVFLEGFDAPEIETVILARGFTVTGAFLQAIGRGLRPAPHTGKTACTVLDLRGAVNLHGLPDEERRWSLTGAAVTRTEALPALAHCKACFAVFRPARQCPRCGARQESSGGIPRTLSRVERLERVTSLPRHERDRRYLAQLERVALHRMRLPPHAAQRWARARFRTTFQREPAEVGIQ